MALLRPSKLKLLHRLGAAETNALQGTRVDSNNTISRADTQPIIPHPTLFDAFHGEVLPSDAVSTVGECATHLELLEVFHTLRNNIIHSREIDDCFGIHPAKRIVYHRKQRRQRRVAKELRDTGFEGRRREKWTYYLNIATARFNQWIRCIDALIQKQEISPWGPKILPPLDVLVVWHAFLLNPSDFKEYCTNRDLQHAQKIIFPWREIHTAINSNDWTYKLPEDHAGWILRRTMLEPDLFHILAKDDIVNHLARDLLRHFSLSQWYNVSDKLRKANERQKAFIQTVHVAIKDRTKNLPMVENVQRQCVFVDKMHSHRWIRSPAVAGTLRRAIDRYENFLVLFRLYPNKFLVPTLDVDLVWHTHQCNAEHYRQVVTERVGRFINHEDKITRGTLDTGFTSTEQWYRLRFGEPYQVCLCWYCEAILSAVEDEEEKEGSMDVVNVEEIADRVDKKVHYYRDVEISRRVGRRLPNWNHDFAL